MNRDSVLGTITVALALSLVCATVVATAAVALRPIQAKNAELERRRNILLAAGLYDADDPAKRNIEELFKQVETRLVNLETGEYVEGDPAAFDAEQEAKDDVTGTAIPPEQDIAGIKRRSKLAGIYLINDEQGELLQFVFPIKGKGLWSTMYGFLAVAPDLRTVNGITWYKQGETPGLGGEISSEWFMDEWPGKKIYGPEGFVDDEEFGNVQVRVIKGNAEPGHEYFVDGISGATITANGVTNTMRYWFGPDGFGPFIEKHAPDAASAGSGESAEPPADPGKPIDSPANPANGG
ncbi:MAG TPA: Na(+)-translocating NADH-quinone reductase subunit C [Pirellulaceae bacterium]|jgi:Na+-transporting NADH:ubiquinone oxidoreductase subunit C|nr:Na(+)-translocating NADH-quinone reductase subunit C [Pirellulaceae bacterium]